MNAASPSSNNLFRRNFPRRDFKRSVGILFKGSYFMAQSGEIGEGGMSIVTDMVLTEGEPLVVSFQIPGGVFVSLRAEVRNSQKTEKPDTLVIGLAFTQIEFALKRQIRSYVSSRSFQ